MDISVHFSDNGFSLGGKNSADIPLSQVIELSDSGQLTTDVAGNYLFYKSGNDIEPTEIMIGEGDLGEATDTTLTYHIKTEKDTHITSGRFLSNLSFSKKWDIEYKNDSQGNSIRDFYYLSTVTSIDIYTNFKEISDFTDNVTLSYEIPSYYDVEDESQLTETLTPSELASEHHHTINITGVDFKKKKLKEGEQIGYNSKTGEIIMKGDVKISGSAKILLSEYEKAADPFMRIHIVVGALTTNAVTGRFDKTENVSLDPITFENLPKFIRENEVQVDIENPVVRMTLDNEVPANVKMDASLLSYKNDERIAQLNIGEKYGTEAIEFTGADATTSPKRTNIWITRIPTEIPDSVSKNIVVSNMMDLIKTIPDRVDVLAQAHTDSTQIVTLSLGTKYKASPKYELVAPLKMGSNMQIVYTTKIDSLIEKLDDTDVGELYFNADATNNIPLELIMEVIPLDENGNTLRNIKIEAPDPIPGMSTKNITFRLINSTDNEMSLVDCIRIKAYAHSGDTMAGKHLNKDQNLRLDNVKLQIKDTSINL